MPHTDTEPFAEECLARNQLEQLQLRKLRTLGTQLNHNPFYTKKLEDTQAPLSEVQTMDEFRTLPFTTKTELCTDQANTPPYGTNLSYPLDQYVRLHQTSGSSGNPLRWLDTSQSWEWVLHCWQLIYAAAGIRSDDRLFFPFSFGPFIGFWAAFEGATQLGAFTLSGGGMTTQARLNVILTHSITTLCCTPTYALKMAKTAETNGLDLANSPVRALILAGEPGASIPTVRQQLETSWGARVFDHTGMTEIGSASIECTHAPSSPHILESEFIAEVIDPNTLEPCSDDGELVLTNLGRHGSPLIRYRTGDRVQIDRTPCTCGRTTARLQGGILGRHDDMIFIKGNNVYPANIENLVREHACIREFQIIVSETDGLNGLNLEIEAYAGKEDDANEAAKTLATAIHDQYYFNVPVDVLATGTLPDFDMKARRLVDNRRNH